MYNLLVYCIAKIQLLNARVSIETCIGAGEGLMKRRRQQQQQQQSQKDTFSISNGGIISGFGDIVVAESATHQVVCSALHQAISNALESPFSPGDHHQVRGSKLSKLLSLCTTAIATSNSVAHACSTTREDLPGCWKLNADLGHVVRDALAVCELQCVEACGRMEGMTLAEMDLLKSLSKAAIRSGVSDWQSMVQAKLTR